MFSTLALVGFAFAASITPGPNNIMLLSSGTNFGLWRTLPHMLGVVLGLCAMLLLVGCGLASLFYQLPWLEVVLQCVGTLYLLYLAFRIATSTGSLRAKGRASRPMSFLEAMLFQWVNAKAWTMSVTVLSLYAPGGEFLKVAWTAAVFCLVGLPCVAVWTILGSQLKRWLETEKKLRAFNVAAALLLVASVLLLFVDP